MKYIETKVGRNDAALYGYLLDENISSSQTRKWPCVIIVPGGGYLTTSTKEGEGVAARFFGAGCSCFVLRYSTRIRNKITHLLNENFSYPDPSIELLEALHLIKENAKQWHIDDKQIYINGFSAGAHVALTSILRNDESFIRNRLSFVPSAQDLTICGLILGYPMLSAGFMDDTYRSLLLNRNDIPDFDFDQMDMSRYLKNCTCPLFVWQTANDEIVDPVECCRFVTDAMKQGIKVEFHLFENGPHGLAMADERYARSEKDIEPSVAVWFDLALTWMKNQESKD